MTSLMAVITTKCTKQMNNRNNRLFQHVEQVLLVLIIENS